MKFLQAFEEYGSMIGVHPLREGEKSRFNRLNVCVLFLFSVFFILATAYLMLDVHTLRSYAEAFFPWFTLGFVFAGYVFNILKSVDIFRFRDIAEHLIQSGMQITSIKS